jgi:hypothetical protein
MWEAEGTPLETHNDFWSGTSSRITLVGPSDPEDHPTKVASVMLGAGLFTNGMDTSVGMAYAEKTLAYGSTGSVLNQIFTLPQGDGELQTGQVRAHNHSYSDRVGWGAYDLPKFSGDALWWFGDIGVSRQESHWFGRYDTRSEQMDDTVRQVAWALPVYSSASDPDDSPSGILLSNSSLTYYSVVQPDGSNPPINWGGGYFITYLGSTDFPGAYNGQYFWPSVDWAGVSGNVITVAGLLKSLIIFLPPSFLNRTARTAGMTPSQEDTTPRKMY